ncbi:polysaccharide deacetylase family protein [Spirillospora sp. CA-294931]|uniref:polysaccharide deacetylase family protein n=1 Tax=Spirillospora sp. CA-294931 TaxID=3240042 RepID=UPI003D8E6565
MRNRISVAIAVGGLLLASGCGQETRSAGQMAAKDKRARAAAQQPKPPPPRAIDCQRVKCVALTFDDGPGAYTGKVLDDLRASGARATFFMLGQNVGGAPGIVRRMALEGHELANHSWSHPMLTGLSTAAVRSQVKRTQRAIATASGGVTPTLFRPPYGATNAQVGRAVGMPQIMWSVDSLDWQHRSVRRNIQAGVNEPKRGGVVLFHDIHKATAAAVPKVVSGLKRRGFTPVTVSELFRGQRLKPGHRYNERETPRVRSTSH